MVGAMLAFAVVALVLIVVTRGRLGYRWDEVGMRFEAELSALQASE